jgi:hypothetical protein
MAKHRFVIGVSEGENVVGTQCARCGQIVLFENGRVPDDIAAQECPQSEDFSQTAVRIVREAAEKV